jgi:hypothetical protein
VCIAISGIDALAGYRENTKTLASLEDLDAIAANLRTNGEYGVESPFGYDPIFRRIASLGRNDG